jgi:DNA-binding NtrC family response regulator
VDTPVELPAPAPLADTGESDVEPAAMASEVELAPSAARVPPKPTSRESPASTAVPKGEASPEEHPLVLRIPVGTTLAEAERLLIIRTLEVAEGNKQRAARILGISRRGLYTKLATYGEHVPAEEAAENNAAEPPAPSA